MNLLKFAAALILIAPASCQNLRADKVISNPSTQKGPASRLSEDSIVVHQARHLSRRLEYEVVDGCIVGNLSGVETKSACGVENLNCCLYNDSCQWDQKDVKICANSCSGEFSCFDGPSSVGPGSCTGAASCHSFTGESVGANSCTDISACFAMSGSVGDGSCNSEKACYDAGPVGSGSCNSDTMPEGAYACFAATSVGDCVDDCWGVGSCQDNTDEIFNPDTSQCVSRSASPTAAPSSSPTSIPTQSLSKSGTELLTDAFNSLIGTDQSGLTNQLKHAINSALSDLERAKNVDLNTDNLFSAIEDTARAGKALHCYPNPNPSFESVCDIIGSASLSMASLLPSLE